jgi:hypothetical protein
MHANLRNAFEELRLPSQQPPFMDAKIMDSLVCVKGDLTLLFLSSLLLTSSNGVISFTHRRGHGILS